MVYVNTSPFPWAPTVSGGGWPPPSPCCGLNINAWLLAARLWIPGDATHCPGGTNHLHMVPGVILAEIQPLFCSFLCSMTQLPVRVVPFIVSLYTATASAPRITTITTYNNTRMLLLPLALLNTRLLPILLTSLVPSEHESHRN